MKFVTLSLLTGILITLSGCQHKELVSITGDPETGKSIKTTYTKYYNVGVWLIPHHLGMSVVVDQLDEYSGKITIYAWNRDKTDHTLKFLNISSSGSAVVIKNDNLVAVGDERSGLVIGTFEVSNYATSVQLELSYELNGVFETKSLLLQRRTPDEMKRFFGKGGTPPYPWYHDKR